MEAHATNDPVLDALDQLIADTLDDPGRAVMTISRVIATTRLAREQNIPRRRARHLVDRARDEQIRSAMHAAGLAVSAEEVERKGVREWIAEHWDLIQQIASVIISIVVLL